MGKLSELQESEIVIRYLRGDTTTTLGQDFSVNPATIQRVLIKLNVNRRSREQAGRVYQCDHTYFDVIDCEDKAYWLGFLAADGYIGNGNMLWLELGAKDEDHLDRFRCSLQSGHPIHKYARRSRFFLRSKRLVNALSWHGVTQRKTLTVPWPNLSQRWLPHYLRGYFDGDGSLIKSPRYNSLRWQITSNERLLFGAREYLVNACGLNRVKLTRLYPVTPVFSLVYGGTGQAIRLSNLMYQDATLCLPRKRDKLIQFLTENPKFLDRYDVCDAIIRLM